MDIFPKDNDFYEGLLVRIEDSGADGIRLLYSVYVDELKPGVPPELVDISSSYQEGLETIDVPREMLPREKMPFTQDQ